MTEKAEQTETSSNTINDILCPCVNLTVDDAAHYLSQNPNMTFEKFLQDTKAGETCTACRLDLEVAFTSGLQLGATPGATKAHIAGEKISLKQQIYSFIDSLTPPMPMTVREVAPIILGPDIEQMLVISNDLLLYERDPENLIGAVDVRLTVRNSKGAVRKRLREQINIGTAAEFPVSDFLIGDDMAFGCGSVEILRKWMRPGVRGTSRPQILLSTKKGCSAVHTQGVSGPGESWMTATWRPADERLFVAIVNCGVKAKYSVTYPFIDGKESPTDCVKIELAANAAELIEITPNTDSLREGDVFSTQVHAGGAHKWYILSTAPDYSQLTIDHPASE
jgi:hypothetical protein